MRGRKRLKAPRCFDFLIRHIAFLGMQKISPAVQRLEMKRDGIGRHHGLFAENEVLVFDIWDMVWLVRFHLRFPNALGLDELFWLGLLEVCFVDICAGRFVMYEARAAVGDLWVASRVELIRIELRIFLCNAIRNVCFM